VTQDRTSPETSAGDVSATSVEALQRDRDDLYDRLLRSTAEFDNYRKRAERERRDLIDTAASDLVQDLLPVVDDFDRALVAPVAAPDSFRKGIELIHRRLRDVLRARGVEPFESVGQTFDPAWHEAVATAPVEGAVHEGEIVAELRRGYRLNGRLLRPAQVKVAQS
jgi:molecular chaperone GrpE